jgi:hypothetical protein
MDTFVSLHTLDKFQLLAIEGESISPVLDMLDLLKTKHKLPNKLPEDWTQLIEYETPPTYRYSMAPRRESFILGGWDSM